jgi:hypothetical protein
MKFRITYGAAIMAASFGAVAAGLVGTTGIASAAPSGSAYTCTGGDLATANFTSIPSGNYASITVTGVCNIQPDAVINVVGNINVAAGSFLDAQSAPSTITVGHNVTAASGSFLGFGCQPANAIGKFAGVPCMVEPGGHTTITVDGNVTATDANTVLLRDVTVNGNITLTGGGGAAQGILIPWSLKGNTIGRNLTISGVTADWLGVQFSTISGNATLTDITATDPTDQGTPTIQIVVNTVGRNLNCTGLAPAVSGGLFPGEVNIVGGKATGQCANLMGGS